MITFTATANPSPDFDGDGTVGFSDFVLFATLFGMSESEEFDVRFDLDENGARVQRFCDLCKGLRYSNQFPEPMICPGNRPEELI